MTIFTGFKSLQMAEGARGSTEKSLVDIQSGSFSGSSTATAEVQKMVRSGTRSNLVTVGTFEAPTIYIQEGFDSGVTQSDTVLTVTGINSVTHDDADNGAWGTGGALAATTDWSYTQGSGSGAYGSVGGRLNYSGSTDVSLGTGYVSFTVVITQVGTGNLTISLGKNSSVNNIEIASGSINSLGTHNFNGSAGDFSATTISDGDYISLTTFSLSGDWTYEVTNIEVHTGSSVSTSYQLKLDTGNTTVPGTLSGSFGDNKTATTALNEIRPLIFSTFNNVSVGGVISRNLSQGNLGVATVATRDTTTTIADNEWDLRETGVYNATTSSYTDWDDWAGKWFFVDNTTEVKDYFNKLVVPSASLADRTIINGEITITNGSNTITATVAKINYYGSLNTSFEITSITSQSGTPPASPTGGWTVTFTADAAYKGITITTSATQDLLQIWTLAQNEGTGAKTEITSVNGSTTEGTIGVPSTYQVVNPAGTNTGAVFTGSVLTTSSSDSDTIRDTIISKINATSGQTAVADGNDISITYDATGTITGLWEVTATHDGSVTEGNLDFVGSEVTEGAATVTGNATWTLSGGGLTSSITETGSGTFTASGITTKIATDIGTDTKVFLRGDTMETFQLGTQTDVSFTVTGDVVNNLVTDVRTLQDGGNP